ncbi:MAG TPA: hypothetical protein VMI11_01125 [Actinomycetes bacterium]|nr:hypothetical protein [Actinomycetes bacterium]
MNRAGEAAVALTAALVLGGAIGWLLSGGQSGGGSAAPSGPVSVAPSASPVASSAVAGSPTQRPGSPVASAGGQLVSTGAITVTATPPSAGRFAPIVISGVATGVAPGTTLTVSRQGAGPLATTQVGRAGAYRLTLELGRSGVFVIQAVDGSTVLATSAPFSLTITP